MVRVLKPLALALAVAGLANAARAASCTDLLPARSVQAQAPRSMTAKDQIELRDIGPASPGSVAESIFSVSHNGEKLAFQLRRANTETNSMCFGVVVLDLKTDMARLIDEGGDPDLGAPRSGAFAAFTPSGLIVNHVPQFSPDDRMVAFLRCDEGTTRLWWRQESAPASASSADVSFDVEDFAWLPNGSGLIFSGRPGLGPRRTAIAEEGRRGFLFDDRWMPANSNVPFVTGPVETEYFVVNVGDGKIRKASNEEQTVLMGGGGELPSGAVMGERAVDETMAWTSLADSSDVSSSTILNVRRHDGAASVCASASCQHVVGLWLSRDGRTLYFMNREGWAQSQLALYRWTSGEAQAQRLFITDDVFLGCQMAAGGLLCGYERSAQPRRLVRIDLDNSAVTSVFDPNPEFASIRTGAIRRLHWTNAYGVQGFGDLVLPPEHRPGERHPLVVVQYQTRGFLRGGTGDAFPIQVLAAHGMAVLSVEKPSDLGAREGGKTWEDIGRLDRIKWIDRKSIESSIETGIARARDLGVVDTSRLGISGLSDGASGTQFALVNSKIFKAAAIETCCEEPSVIEFIDGPEVAKRLHNYGYPTIDAPDARFWKGMSFRQNVRRITTPLLMQLSDREYLGALEGYSALKAADRPVEMYVFPDEYHIMWQPAHRLAEYDRAVDWFQFWLRDNEDPTPDKASQYQRWQTLRGLRDRIVDASPGK